MKLPVSLILSLFVMGKAFLGAADIPAFEWESEQIDEIEIGYGLQLEDVDGDGDRDILLADKKTVQWYENPDWTRHVIAKDLTVRDNVCIAARDIDGDGKCEIAIGGQWNFLETRKDGAVHYLVAGDDRSQPWKPVKLYHEPSVHRMHWIRNEKDEYSLIVKPLRGIGSVDGIGPGIRILEYRKPDDPS
ncbi:MAG: VCBS repeat-containing protein, partial [Verrucomicrobiota bacterium]